jgi:hypothetical protein
MSAGSGDGRRTHVTEAESVQDWQVQAELAGSLYFVDLPARMRDTALTWSVGDRIRVTPPAVGLTDSPFFATAACRDHQVPRR